MAKWLLQNEINEFKDKILEVIAIKDKRLENLINNIDLSRVGNVLKFTNGQAVSKDIPVGGISFTYNELCQHDNSDTITLKSVNNDYMTISNNTITFKQDTIMSLTFQDGIYINQHQESPIELELYPVNGFKNTFAFSPNSLGRFNKKYQYMYYSKGWISVEFEFHNVFIKANNPIELRTNVAKLKGIKYGGLDGLSNFANCTIQGVTV